VAAAASDAGAAEGLATAYASMGPEGRRQLVEAVVDDARLDAISPAAALAALLGVETEASIAHVIFRALRETGGEGLTVPAAPRALWEGDADRGSAALVRPLYGRFVELLHVAWNADGIAHATTDPLVGGDEVERRLAALPESDALEPAAFDRTVDRLAVVLWRHRRRHGDLPPALHRLADCL
jgi:hypothetical protein